MSAVYENSAGVSGSAPPQIFLFIGGNLAGESPAGFISSFTAQFKGAAAVDEALGKLNRTIAATQLGITLASIGLGWAGLASMVIMLIVACRRGSARGRCGP